MNRKIGVGVLWNLASAFMTRGASTIFTLLLARLLAPEAFGLVAMATVVFELANVFVSSGLGQALIRSKEVSRADLNTVFYTNLLLSGIAYSVLFGLSPFVASFYGQPELTTLVRVMGLVVFLNAAKVVQTAVLSREMDFKTQMKANTLGVLVSGSLALTLAWLGWGVWSLVAQMLSAAVMSALILWWISEWHPSLQFSCESFVRLFRFGRNLLAEGMLSVLYQNSYMLVIGRLFGAETAGLYFFARKVSNLVSQQLTRAVQQATYPALARLQDDNFVLRNKYRQILQLMMFLIAPTMALLAGLASPLFRLLFNEQWQPAIPYLQLLCLVGMLYPLHALNMNLLNVKGRSDLVLKVGLVKKALNLTLLFVAIPYGVIGIVVSQVVGAALSLVPNTYFSSKFLGYGLREQLLDAFKPILAAVGAGLSAFWLAELFSGSAFTSFVSGGLGGALAFLVLALFFRVDAIRLLLDKVGFFQPLRRFFES
ncbi:lipopolysaccharide biosynthesis protein [Marinobacter sp. M216]|uniref:Lipopolysaccharide biosynthesis protein n=1 Tax=Marinobacter albus TaxID=3030833 RepID=A0ABT7HA79_9GAMM|nr:lipopolysaccharide biosynthesis protein [Marinobacter sp. M216]MDK9557244.1 lipopolysaccharide biosynthesis protein [Marinobacter sp. M216]